MRNLILNSLFALLFIGGSVVNAQISGLSTEQSATIHGNIGLFNDQNRYLSYVFPQDSLAGFDESAAKQGAMQTMAFGLEYHYYMYAAKRNYINNKYGINIYDPNSSLGFKPILNPTTSINAAPCVNEDFESSPASATPVGNNLTGWQVSTGQNSGANGSCLQTGCCPTAGSNLVWVRATPWADPAPGPMGTIGASPFGGNNILQMGTAAGGGDVHRIQQTFPVTPTNALFRIAYRAALQAGHACCDQPYLRIEILNCNNQILACPQVSVIPPGPSCSTVSAAGWITNSSTYVTYTPNWLIKALDLTPYIGSCVTIRITVGDCPYSGHYGYAYIDCQCMPMNVNVNNINFPAGSSIVQVAACSVSTATMTAPPGLGPYTWNGPAGSGITNNPNQTITTAVAGIYTLVMNPVGVCVPITKTISLQFGTFPNAGFTVQNNCTTYTITNTGTQAPSIQTYTIVGPGGPPSYSTTNVTSVVNLNPNTTYTIYQTVTNPQNCPATFSMVITTPNGPSPAFTAAPSFTQCITQNFTFNAAVTAGTHTYVFTPAVNAPPPGFTSSYGPVMFTAPGNYTVTHTINNAGCIASTSSVVVVNAVPGATILSATPPPCVGSTASLTGIGGPGLITWAGPNNWTGVGPNAQVPNFTQASAGIYTMTVNNFGCIITRTVNLSAPPGPTVNVGNNGPVCVGSPLTFTANYTGSPSYFYWYHYTPTPYFYYYGGYNLANVTATTAATASFATTFTFYIAYPGCPVAQYTTQVQVTNLATPTVANTGPYCPGATIQLNANVATATTFSWSGPSGYSSTQQNPSIPNALPAMGGVYTITTAIGNCKKTASTTVSIHPLPNPIAGSNSPVCAAQSINLTASAAASYTWSGPNGFSSNVQNPVIPNSTTAMSGTYTLAVTSAQGCTNVTTVNVSIITSTTTASNTGPYCAGANIVLNTPAANNYNWSGPNGFTSTQQNPVIGASTPAMSGNYTVISTVGTCTAMATTAVTVNALPTPTAANTGPYCAGQNIQLTVGGFNSYSWTGPNSFTSAFQNPSINNAQVVSSGNYTVLVTDANNCTNTATTNVVVNPLPVIVVNNPTVCENTDIFLTSNGGSSYSWTGPLGFNSALQNPTITPATPAMTGNYVVLVTSAAGCTQTAIANVSVVPIPTVSISGGSVMCSQNLNGSINTVVLNGNGASTYMWSLAPGFFATPNLSSTSFTLTPPVTTTSIVATMSVIGTAAGNCTNSAVYNVTVIPNPTVVPTPATYSICEGTSITMNVIGANTYTWSPSNTLNTNIGSSVIGNPLTTTIYSIIGTTDGCNSATETTTLLVVPNPTISILPGTPTLCIGDNMNLNAFGATTYTWIPNIAISTTVGNVVNVNPSVTMTYSVFGTQSTCTNVAAVTVTVKGLPAVNASVSSPTLCMQNYNGSPNTITLTAMGATSYTWGGFVGMSASATTGNTIIATSILNSAALSGTVLGFDGHCYNTAVYSALAIDNPIISVSSASVCFGKSIDLFAGGAITYTWSPSNSLNSSTGSSVSANPSQSTVYSVVGSSVGCNSPTETGTVIVVPNPILSIAPLTPTICEGSSIGLNATGATSYTWYPSSSLSSSTAANVVASPTITTNYTLVGSAASCTSEAIRQVRVYPLPILQAASTKTALCLGESTTINSNGSGTYTWVPSYGVDNPHSNFVTVSPTVSTTYTILGQNGPCFNSMQFPITVLKYPVMEVTTNLQKVCQGSSTSIFASGAQTYSWAPAVANIVGSGNVAQVTPTVSTNYTVMGINVSGTVVCMMTKEILIDVVPTITANGGYSLSVCKGESGKLGASGGNTYRWSPEEYLSNAAIQSPYVKPLTTTIYTVRVSDGGFCTQTATVLVQVKPTPTVDAGADMTYNKDEVMYLNAQGTGALKWIVGDGIVCRDCPNSQIVPSTSGCYIVEATYPNGCKAEDEVCIEITNEFSVYIPNVFTPNDDGKNDTFLVYGVGISNIDVTVFDRWGEELYHEEDQKKGWDGFHNGVLCKNDAYVYKVTFSALDGRKYTKTGHVTLLK